MRAVARIARCDFVDASADRAGRVSDAARTGRESARAAVAEAATAVSCPGDRPGCGAGNRGGAGGVAAVRDSAWRASDRRCRVLDAARVELVVRAVRPQAAERDLNA